MQIFDNLAGWNILLSFNFEQVAYSNMNVSCLKSTDQLAGHISNYNNQPITINYKRFLEHPIIM